MAMIFHVLLIMAVFHLYDGKFVSFLVIFLLPFFDADFATENKAL